MAIVLVLLVALVSTALAHYENPPAPPMPPYYYPTIPCPSHPKSLCDFYFDGYENIVPTFYLDDGVKGDHALVPKQRSTLNWVGDMSCFSPAIKDYVSEDFVLANTKNATFLTYPDGTYDYQWALDTFDQFYLNARTDAKSHLYARSWHEKNEYWHQENRCFYENKCVFLPFTSVMFHTNTTNLNIADKNEVYPEHRRCVVFKTKQ